ncbi:hypothetical protein ACSFC1_00185 [Pseudothermotoga sp. U03pept]|uniref:hypothetical protein n=1 Tax=Pseudothermotoga sp. U03pept TaxID=3447012 RepID=UPI003F04FD6A
MKIRFGNIADTLVGVKEIEVQESSLKKIFQSISQSLNKRVELIVDEKEESVYLLAEKDGKLSKSWVVALNNGINILDADVNSLREGELVIFVPVSGG